MLLKGSRKASCSETKQDAITYGSLPGTDWSDW